MCVTIVLVGCFKSIPLVMMHARDEDLARPASPVALCGDVLCGLDGLHGGTWAGFHPASGTVAVLTNVRTQDTYRRPQSRGALVLDVLRGVGAPEGEVRHSYGPYNVLQADLYAAQPRVVWRCCPQQGMEDEACYVDNTPLSSGVHALSNSYLDDTSWPKVRFLREGCARIVTELGTDYQLRAEAEGGDDVVASELVERLSALFLHKEDVAPATPGESVMTTLKRLVYLHGRFPNYGTSCHTLVLRTLTHVFYCARALDAQTGLPEPWKVWRFAVPAAQGQ